MPEKEPSQDPYVYTENPLTTEQLLPTSASQQLFNTYTSRIEDFPGFSQRSFHEARADFEKTIIEANDSADIADVRMLLHQLVDPNSYEELKDDLATYWDRHKLESDLQTYSYCFLTNHRFFSDLPTPSVGIPFKRNCTNSAPAVHAFWMFSRCSFGEFPWDM
jgi:hypothetical protein